MFDCNEPVDYGTATATDNCSTATTSFTWTTNGPTACNMVNGILYGYDIYVVWTATDGCGNSVSETRNIWVLGSGMSFFNKPADKNVACGLPITWNQPMVKSLFGPIVSVTFADVSSLNACGAGTIVRTWTATDAVGNTCLAEQTNTLLPDSEGPVSGLVFNSRIPPPVKMDDM